MHDIHVLTVVQCFEHVTTLRFDFRTGLDGGASAREDLRAACRFLRSSIEAPPERLLLVGYSYGSLIVADVAPSLPECCAFALLSPPLGAPQIPMVGFGHDPPAAAARSPKPKLALIGTHDQFCSVRRFEAWADTLRAPAEHRVVLGHEIERPCCGGQHTVTRRALVHHFNMYGYLQEHLSEWVLMAFGMPIEKLGASDGSVVVPA